MNKHSGITLISPRITEKGAYLAEKGCYVFNVARSATKKEVAQAMQEVYKVLPRKVALIAVPGKEVRTRGTNRPGRTAQGKKAYVYLKPGETIEIV
jgi:large subunit ribosomal protein L23